MNALHRHSRSHFHLVALANSAAAQKPEWCKQLPRPEYKKLIRMSTPDPWFEVYSVRPGVLAIYEPQQAEEVISYLILGKKRALLFDTGMGISDMKKLVQELDHVAGQRAELAYAQ